jgi:hypothetical protein
MGRFATAGSQAKRALAIRLGGTDDLTDSPHLVWQYSKGTAYVPSPILYGPYLYLMTDKGLLTCLEATTGRVLYEGGRVPVPATFTASPVAFADRLLLTSEDGDTFVIRAGPVHEVIATSSVGGAVYASPALAGSSSAASATCSPSATGRPDPWPGSEGAARGSSSASLDHPRIQRRPSGSALWA